MPRFCQLMFNRQIQMIEAVVIEHNARIKQKANPF